MERSALLARIVAAVSEIGHNPELESKISCQGDPTGREVSVNIADQVGYGETVRAMREGGLEKLREEKLSRMEPVLSAIERAVAEELGDGAVPEPPVVCFQTGEIVLRFLRRD